MLLGGLHAHLLVRTHQSCASAGPTAVVPREARWGDWHCRNHLVGTNCYQGQGMKHQIQGGAFSSVSLSCLLGQSISPSEEVLAGCTSTNKCWMYTSYLDNNNVSARRFQEEGSRMQSSSSNTKRSNWMKTTDGKSSQNCSNSYAFILNLQITKFLQSV